MKVSVLTPLYKTDERILREAIESVLGQTFRDFEFLLLDDLPELYAEYELARRTERRVRLFGVPLVTVTTDFRETQLRLFGRIPLMRISRRFRMEA